MSGNNSELQIETETNKCEFKNGYYKIVYKDKKWNKIFINKKVIISDNTLIYYKTSIPQEKIQWTSNKTFEIATLTVGIDSVKKELSPKPLIKLYEVTNCKKDRIDFILKNAYKKPNGEFRELIGKFIKVK